MCAGCVFLFANNVTKANIERVCVCKRPRVSHSPHPVFALFLLSLLLPPHSGADACAREEFYLLLCLRSMSPSSKPSSSPRFVWCVEKHFWVITAYKPLSPPAPLQAAAKSLASLSRSSCFQTKHSMRFFLCFSRPHFWFGEIQKNLAAVAGVVPAVKAFCKRARILYMYGIKC
jgi:hypothetical protein